MSLHMPSNELRSEIINDLSELIARDNNALRALERGHDFNGSQDSAEEQMKHLERRICVLRETRQTLEDLL